MVAGLMLIISLGAAQFINSQNQQISYMEDRLSRIHLMQEVEQIFGDRAHCLALLQKMRIKNNQDPQNISIVNDLERVIYDPNSENNVYDHLKITYAQVRNLSVKGPNSIGELELLMGVERLRQGGSNTQMTPVHLRIPVVVNNKSFVKSCYPKRAPICGDTLFLQAGKLPDPKKDFKNCCSGGGSLGDCITTGLEATSKGNSIFYICTCD